MCPKYFVIMFHLVVLVHGDLLVDYAEQRLEGLPNWILEKVEDGFSVQTEDYSGCNRGFMSCSLRPFNLTVNGLKSIQTLESFGVSLSLFAGSLSLELTVRMDLKLAGKCDVAGTLFPNVEQIPYTSSGVWYANTTLTMTTLHRIYGHMEISLNGSMSAEEFEMTHNFHEISVSDFYFDNFLEDRSDQWYYPTIKEGFGKALEDHTHLNLNEKISVFEKFFEETFKNINYSDIIGG